MKISFPEYEVGGTCSTMKATGTAHNIFIKNLKGRHCLEELAIDRREILKRF
jgi:hypothetical protein